MPAPWSASRGPTCEEDDLLLAVIQPPVGRTLKLCSCLCCSFMFDEPSSYLDVKQRLKAAITIRSLITPDR